MPQPSTAATARRGRPGYDQSEVLAAAVRLFTRHGYAAASMGMLAEELGISKSGIYHHVPSKAELLRLALDDALSALEQALSRAEQDLLPARSDSERGSPSPLDTVRSLLRATVDVLLQKQEEVRLLLHLRGNSEVEVEALRRRRDVDARTAALIARAQKAGQLRTDLSARELARLMFGSINSIVEWHRPAQDDAAGKAADANLADGVVSLLLEGAQIS